MSTAPDPDDPAFDAWLSATNQALADSLPEGLSAEEFRKAMVQKLAYPAPEHKESQ